MALSTVLSLAAAAFITQAQTITTAPPISTPTIGDTPLPLTQYHFAYPNLVSPEHTLLIIRDWNYLFQPEKVNPFQVGRGPQSGYNICNSTTARL